MGHAGDVVQMWLGGEASRYEWLEPGFGRDQLLRQARMQAGRPPCSPSVITALQRASGRSCEGDESVAESIRRLAAGAVVVATGQQPGLFGGPLLVAAKIASAIRLARWLTEHGIDAVPLFWNASEDHDLGEANRLYRRDDQGQVRLRRAPIEPAGMALWRIRFTGESVEEMRRWFTPDELASGVDDELPRIGEGFGDWMERITSRRFGGNGLLVVQPKDIAASLGGFHQRALDRTEDLRRRLSEAAVRFQRAGWNAPLDVPPDGMSFVFSDEPDGRRRLSIEEARERVGTDAIMSSSVVLRPLAQQAAFPVAAQVCGPGEMSYMLQLRGLFEVMGETAPMLWPRTKIMLGSSVDRRLAEDPTAKRLADFEERLRQVLAPLIDVFPLETRDDVEKRADRLVKAVHKGFKRSEKKRDPTAGARRHNAREWFYPRGRPQERVFSMIEFCSLGINATIRRIIAAADPMAIDATRRWEPVFVSTDGSEETP